MLDPDQVKYLRSLVRQDKRRTERKAAKLPEKFGEAADLSRHTRKIEFIDTLADTLSKLP